MNRALLQQALDFCVFCWRDVDMNDYAFERLESTIDALRAELDKPEPEPVGHQFQSRDGNWNDFLNQKHYEGTLADGSWPIRAIYAAPTEPNCKFPVCHSQEYQNKLVQEILEPTDGYVQPVPDKCDRIVWRNKYYHLPL